MYGIGEVSAFYGENLNTQQYKTVDVRDVAENFMMGYRLSICKDYTPVRLEDKVNHGWNRDDSSSNIYVQADKLTLFRYGVENSTDCIRGKVGFTEGLHIWEIHWPKDMRGSNAVVGVATEDAPLHCRGRKNLVGRNDQSWGWDLGRNKLYHDSKYLPRVRYPTLLAPNEKLEVPDTFRVVLDSDFGTLSFMADGHFLGVAFHGLEGKKLFPIISTVKDYCEIKMSYIGGYFDGPEPPEEVKYCR